MTTKLKIDLLVDDKGTAVVTNFGTKAESAFKLAAKGALVFGAAFAGISVGVAKVLNEFQPFETALVDMGKVTGRSLEEIRAEIMALPPELGSATQLMQGYYQVISAGVTDPVKALEMLTTSAMAGKAAHVDQAEVVKGLTKVMAGYEGEVRSAADAADLLFAIERVGQTTVAELVPHIGGLAKASHDLGISQDELGGSFAQVTQLAGNSDEAATLYMRTLTSLMKPSKAMNEALKSMGYESAQAAIKSIGFTETLKQLSATAGGSQVKMAALFGNIRAIRGVAALSVGDFKGMADKIEDMGNKTGSMDKAFREWMVTLEASKEAFRNTIGKVLIDIGEEIAPTVIAAMKSIGDVIIENKDNLVILAKASVITLEGIIDLCNAVVGAFFTMADAILLTIGIFKEWASNVVNAIEDVANALPDAVTEADLFTESANNASAGLDGMLKSAHGASKEIGLIATHTIKANAAIKGYADVSGLAAAQQKDLGTVTNKTKEEIKAEAKEIKAAKEYVEKLALSFGKLSKSVKEEAMLERKHMDLTAADYAKHNEAMVKFRENRSEKIKKITAEETQAINSLYEMLGGSLRRTDESYFEFKKKMLDDEKQRYIDLFGETALINEAFAQRYIELEHEKMRASDDFFAGVKAGLYDITQDTITWGDVGYETIRTFNDSGTAALTDFFNFTGDGFLDLGELAGSVFDNMVEMWSEMLAKFIMRWASAGLEKLIGGIGDLLGIPSLGDLLGLGGAAAGGAAGAGAAAAGGAGAGALTSFGFTAAETEAALAGGGAVAAPTGAAATGTAAAGSSTAAGLAAAAPYMALALAVPLLGPTITATMAPIMRDLFGSNPTSPSAGAYVSAWEQGLSTFRVEGLDQDFAVPADIAPLKELFNDWFLNNLVWGTDIAPAGDTLPNWAKDNEYLNSFMSDNMLLADYIQNMQDLKSSTAASYWAAEAAAGAHATGGPLLANEMFLSGRGPLGESAFWGGVGEGVVNNDAGMNTLAEINNGTLVDRLVNAVNSASGGSDRPIYLSQKIVIDGHEIVNVVTKYGPGDPGYRDSIQEIAN